jgi:hypothetical protein
MSADVACPASGTSLASPAEAASGTQRSHHVWSYDLRPQFSSGPGKSGELGVSSKQQFMTFEKKSKVGRIQ